MALGDREHVEAVAIIRRLVDSMAAVNVDDEAVTAGLQWLAENHPPPSVYMDALRGAVALYCDQCGLHPDDGHITGCPNGDGG